MRGWILPLLLILVFVLTRLLVLFCSTAIYHDEEEFRGTVAKEIIEGSRFGFLDYQYTPYEGGSLLASVLVVPFYLLFGINVTALKLEGLLIGTLLVLSLYLLSRRFVGSRAAVFVLLVCILAPPYFIRRNLMSMGDFLESMLLASLILYSFLLIHVEQKTGWRHLAAFGLLSGLGVWIHYSTFVMIAACGIWLLLFHLKRIGIRGVISAGIAFILGVTPLIWYNLAFPSAGARRIGEGLLGNLGVGGFVSHFFGKLVALWTWQIPVSFQFLSLGPLDKRVLAYAYYGVFLLSVLILLWRRFDRDDSREDSGESDRKAHPFAFLLFYFVFYSAVYAGTRYKYDLHWDLYYPQSPTYVFHLFLVYLLFIAWGVDALLAHRRKRIVLVPAVAAVMLAGSLGTGFLGLSSLVDSSPTDPEKYIGQPYSYDHLAYMMGEKLVDFPDRAEQVLSRMTPRERMLFARGMGHRASYEKDYAPFPYLREEDVLGFYIGQGTAEFGKIAEAGAPISDLVERKDNLRPLARAALMEGFWEALYAYRSAEPVPFQKIAPLLKSARERDAFQKELADRLGSDFFDSTHSINAIERGRIEGQGFVIEKIVLEIGEGVAVPTNVYVPKDRRERHPLVLVLVSHDQLSKAAMDIQAMCQTFARGGMVAATYDMIGYGEREAEGHEPHASFFYPFGTTHMGFEIWEAGRILDHLLTRPDVDPGRVACTGFSGGGTKTLYLSALDERIGVAAAVCSVTSILQLRQVMERHFWCNVLPGMTLWLDNSDLLGLIAPRPLLVVTGMNDPLFPIPGARRTVAKARYYYTAYGAREGALGMKEVPTSHENGAQARTEVYQWISRWIGGGAADFREPGTKYMESTMLDCGLEGPPRRIRDVLRDHIQGQPEYRSMGVQARSKIIQKELFFHVAPKKPFRDEDELASLLAAELDEAWIRQRLLRAPPDTDTRSVILLAGRKGEQDKKGVIENILRSGYSVLDFGTLLHGESMDAMFRRAKQAVMDGEPLVYREARKIMAAIYELQDPKRFDFVNVYLWASGWDAVPAIMAAAASQRTFGMVLEWCPQSFVEQVLYPHEPPDTYYSLFALPGIWERFDVADMLLVTAPQGLYLSDPLIADDPDLLRFRRENEAILSQAYKRMGADGMFGTGPNGLEEMMGRIRNWH